MDPLRIEYDSTPATWCAYYDPEGYVGRGKTREQALIDLLEKIEDSRLGHLDDAQRLHREKMALWEKLNLPPTSDRGGLRALLREALPYVEAGVTAEDDLADRIEAAVGISEGNLSEKGTVNQTGISSPTNCGEIERERDDLKARLTAMFPLFEEARDALPAIPLASAKLRGVDLTLADRMDAVGDPAKWAAHPSNPRHARSTSVADGPTGTEIGGWRWRT